MFTKSNQHTNTSNSSALFNREDGASFVQPKLNVGKPGDQYEVEADKAADQIVAKSKQPDPSFVSPAPTVQKQTEEDVQKQEAEQEIQQKPVVDPITPGVQLKPLAQLQTEEDIQSKEEEDIQEKEEDQEIQKQSSGNGGEDASGIESQISQSKGGGSPLDSDTKSEMESGFGSDFSNVRIHNDSSAVQMNRDLGAQAFTNGNDIYFNEGKYNPSSDSGKHLLAHELTHTVQQGASPSVQPKMIQKADDAATTTPSAANAEDILSTFKLPAVKARHLSLYQTWASQGTLKRAPRYARGKPNQVKLWKDHFWDKMQNTDKLGLHEDFKGTKTIKTPGNKKISGRRKSLLKKLTIANWDKKGNITKHTLEVDHIVELQTGDWPRVSTANQIENMELLDKSSNAGAGSRTKTNIKASVRGYLEAKGEPSSSGNADDYMKENEVAFTKVELEGGDAGAESQYWTRAEIEAGQHLVDVEDLGNVAEAGSPTEFALFTPDDGYVMQIFPHGETELSFAIGADDPKGKAVAGLKISNITLNTGYETKDKDTNIGNITATWDLPAKFNAPKDPFSVGLKKSQDQYAGKIGALPNIGLNFTGMSPVNFGAAFGIDEEGIFAEGTLTPTIPFLSGTTLTVGVRGTEVYFELEYSPADLNLPIPGLEIQESTFRVGYSSKDGFKVGGEIEFILSKIGKGKIEGGYTEEKGISVKGEIQFDEKLFGKTKASARMAYEEGQWSIGGTLEIPKGQIQGIEKATIKADYSQAEGFIATGDAELSIPGVDKGSMTIKSNDAGFSMEGSFGLTKDIPGIKGGSVEAKVSKEEGEEDYSIYVSGTAQPDVPGINSSLTVTYDNGALTIEGTAQYSRGMLSGEITLGATNQGIGEDGKPNGETDDTMRVYGGGSLTLQLTPWLAATAGVKFLPNGEMEVTARLDAPYYEVFKRQEVNKNLFSVPTIEIPLFAIPLGPKSIGLVAQIGGGLDFTAGFGPGQLRNMSAEITYNPDKEEETTVKGHGEFAIPADAGLTLRGDVSVGISIAIASITGGIELAGSLGLAGEALASVDLDWSPQSGLEINALGSIKVGPKFKFDINAFIRGTLGIGWFSISETWRKNLLSYEWGPGIEFGIEFPINYKEGEPFSMSFDDIKVIYPELDIPEMAKGVATDAKDQIF